jgi:hypothetical protein
MFEYIKLKQEIKRLKKIHDELIDENNILKERVNNPTAEKVIENILGRGIDWYDYAKMDFSGQQGYYQNAQSLLTNETFNNEINRFIADQIKFIGYESKSHEQTMHVRTGIAAIETLVDRIKSISGPQIKGEIPLEKSTEAI